MCVCVALVVKMLCGCGCRFRNISRNTDQLSHALLFGETSAKAAIEEKKKAPEPSPNPHTRTAIFSQNALRFCTPHFLYATHASGHTISNTQQNHTAQIECAIIYNTSKPYVKMYMFVHGMLLLLWTAAAKWQQYTFIQFSMDPFISRTFAPHTRPRQASGAQLYSILLWIVCAWV